MRRCFFAFVLALWLAQAHAQTVQAPITQKDVVQLLQLKTPENEIIDQIKKSGTVFVLGQEDIARLKRAGATEAVIAAMKGGGTSTDADAAAFEITDLALVIDYSGSMNAKTKEGTTKMAAAKEAVGKLIDKLPNDLNVAVVVYGVSKQRGCEDIDLVQPLGPISDKASLKTKLLGLANTGMTPIASSLELAGVALQKAKGGRAIVLVTDGVESCKGDPAAIASRLANEFGVKFGLHVIGFDIKADERGSLEQIAKNGHGKYFNADTASELARAMQKITQHVAVEPKQRETRGTEMAGKAVKPGAFFNDAPLVEAGEYKGQLAMMQTHYYKIPVRKGQELRAVGIVQKTPYKGSNNISNQVFRITIYNDDLSVAARENLVIKDNPTTPGTFRNSWMATSDGIAYVAISASDNLNVKEDGEGGWPISTYDPKNPGPSPYTLRLRTEGEGGPASAPAALPVVAQKPGSGFPQAVEVPMPSLVATDLKLGEVAYYKTKVQKGDALQISAAFRKPWYEAGNYKIEATYTLTLYDDDQVQVAQEKKEVKKNPPDAQSVVLSWPVTISGNLYVSIGCENTGENIYPKEFQPKPGEICVRLTKGSGTAVEEKKSDESKKDAAAGTEPESATTPARQSSSPKEEKKKDPFAGAESESASTPAPSPTPEQ